LADTAGVSYDRFNVVPTPGNDNDWKTYASAVGGGYFTATNSTNASSISGVLGSFNDSFFGVSAADLNANNTFFEGGIRLNGVETNVRSFIAPSAVPLPAASVAGFVLCGLMGVRRRRD
jgi:hypothetical protein